MQVRTPRRNPRRQPERVTASVAPLPFPARSPPRLACSRFRLQVCRGGRIGSVGFKALLRRRVWCRPPPLPVGERPAPSWASFLFKVLHCGRRSRLPPLSLRANSSGSPQLINRTSRELRFAPARPPKRGAGAVPCRSTFQRGPRSKSWSLVPTRWRTIRRPLPPADSASRCSRSRTGEAPRDRGVWPKPEAGTRSGRNPFEGSSRVVCTTRPLVPVAGRAEDSQANLGSFDAVEVCPELKSRGAVRLGFPRCGPAILADLP
jgi:hypothetical protein